ncbi:metallophosphoesterase [Oricola sp.]|uniref:metallophosphoesterase family protein n=1 Tax=Oricola sp. TaxID=1979950 RepID=UPI00260095E6|nr:metallophosphoesterase [Oricola sp.]MCI5074396.1 metallophosphoesterase [Oricola sp.]
MVFKLAHISDVHLGPLPKVRAIELVSKRITGYINWKRNRAAHMQGDTLSRLVTAMQGAGPDHIAVTGDLTNLALDDEIAAAALWLGTLGPGEDVSAVPGNHDAYVPGALARAVSAWRAFMTTEVADVPTTKHGYPYMRTRGPVALIGVNSAVATGPFMASGILSSKQAKSMATLLRRAREKGLFRVVMIHHPPVRRAAAPQKRLFGIRLFQSVIRAEGAELVLHGHTHLPQRHEIDGRDGATVPVIGVPAAGQAPGGHRPAAAFNMFEIGGEPGAWQCRLHQHALTGKTGGATVTETRDL